MAIDEFARIIYDTDTLYIDNLINNKSEITNDYIDSLKGLIDVSTNKAKEKYDKLSQIKGSKQDQIDVLKKGLDKLISMRESLNQYTDTLENKKNLFTDWQVVVNYWKTYAELSKNSNQP